MSSTGTFEVLFFTNLLIQGGYFRYFIYFIGQQHNNSSLYDGTYWLLENSQWAGEAAQKLLLRLPSYSQAPSYVGAE